MQRELKVCNYGNSIGYGDFVLSPCQTISQGPGGGQRIGDHILVKKVVIRVQLTWGGNQEDSYSASIRWVFAKDKRGLFTDATFFDSLYDPAVTTITPLECFNPANVDRFTILHDSFNVLKQVAQSSKFVPVYRYEPVVAPYDFARVFTFDDLDVVVSFPTVGSALNNLVFVKTQFDPLIQLSGTSFTSSVYFEDFN